MLYEKDGGDWSVCVCGGAQMNKVALCHIHKLSWSDSGAVVASIRFDLRGKCASMESVMNDNDIMERAWAFMGVHERTIVANSKRR